jgi:hypothetical protein
LIVVVDAMIEPSERHPRVKDGRRAWLSVIVGDAASDIACCAPSPACSGRCLGSDRVAAGDPRLAADAHAALTAITAARASPGKATEILVSILINEGEAVVYKRVIKTWLALAGVLVLLPTALDEQLRRDVGSATSSTRSWPRCRFHLSARSG